MQPAEVSALLFGGERQRFTQETPILPEVWFAMAEAPEARHDLLITPLNTMSANALVRELLEDLGDVAIEAAPVALGGFVAISLTFLEVVRYILPRSEWAGALTEHAARLDTDRISGDLADPLKRQRGFAKRAATVHDDAIQVIRLMAHIDAERRQRNEAPVTPRRRRPSSASILTSFRTILDILDREAKPASIWRVASDRPLSQADSQSLTTVKADAAYRLFDVQCSEVTWAVVDSGIDVGHSAFTDAGPSRVIASYDFAGLRALLNTGFRHNPAANPQLPIACNKAGLSFDQGLALLTAAHRALPTDAIDWSAIAPLIRLADPERPGNGHGTHVAGIIGGNWKDANGEPIMVGLCPDIRLLDLRVLSAGDGTEFAVISALQFIRYLNGRNDYVAVHGVNMSLSIPHSVQNYACGRTPVCDECERLVGSGVVVVAAAGNQGYQGFTTTKGLFESYATLSITDPGNAESVITVGSTHKREPHTYGVSYFSSRGPTGDGRNKPDLVAPGERIESTLPGNRIGPLDGTSQAAPHVSAAAAMLMSRFPELRGQPRQIKTLLCESATDLGRDKAFQGAGLLDVLRALQSF
jgi:serine protease AprX